MSAWFLIQVVLNIFFALGIFVIVMRMNRAPKDDPRLSRGLQLLQSKISVLEDLSDRTEMQVNQLTAILEQKAREVQAKVQLAEQHVHEIRVSTERSLEVAKIFQDKIPHQEIIERQNTKKYVTAARMAHQGKSIEEIVSAVDLPRGEIEFIAKVNREQLMFDEESLPLWAKENPPEGVSTGQIQMPEADVPGSQANSASADRLRAEIELAEQQRLVESLSRLQFEMQNLDLQLARENAGRDFEGAFDPIQVEQTSLKKIGDEFRKAVEEANQQPERTSVLPPLEHLTSLIPQMISGIADALPAAANSQNVSQPKSNENQANTDAGAEINRDPVLTRAMAQAKVQAALNSSSVPKAAVEVSPELAAARAMAKQEAILKQNPVINGKPNTNGATPLIRKVAFPKIESPEG